MMDKFVIWHKNEGEIWAIPRLWELPLPSGRARKTPQPFGWGVCFYQVPAFARRAFQNAVRMICLASLACFWEAGSTPSRG